MGLFRCGPRYGGLRGRWLHGGSGAGDDDDDAGAGDGDGLMPQLEEWIEALPMNRGGSLRPGPGREARRRPATTALRSRHVVGQGLTRRRRKMELTETVERDIERDAKRDERVFISRVNIKNKP